MGKNSKTGDICIQMADLLCCMVETNNIIKQLYANKLKKKKVCLHFCELIHKHGITWKNDSRKNGWRSPEIPFMTNLMKFYHILTFWESSCTRVCCDRCIYLPSWLVFSSCWKMWKALFHCMQICYHSSLCPDQVHCDQGQRGPVLLLPADRPSVETNWLLSLHCDMWRKWGTGFVPKYLELRFKNDTFVFLKLTLKLVC